jgi:cytochrome P450
VVVVTIAAQHPFTTHEDISSVEFWSRPFVERDETFARLREHAPVSWHPPLETPELPPEVHGEPGFWAVVRGAEVAHVSRNHELFSSDEAKYGSGSILMRPADPAMVEKPTFLSMDPPEHSRYRRVMSDAFTPRAVARINDLINARAARIVERVVGAGEIDFVSEVSGRLPMLTVADMIGVPEDQVATFAEAGDRALRFYDPSVNGGADPLTYRIEQLGILREIGVDLVERRRREPADDIATALAQAEIDGKTLSDADLQSIMILLSVAGTDTTKQTTSHTVCELWRDPEQKAWLAEDFDGRIRGATEEFVRHATPVIQFARTATQDVELGGQPIRAGDKVVIFYASANRDERVFDDPHRFDLARPPKAHYGFGGGGVHFCLGSGVAKVQLRALVREILDKLPNMEVGEPEPLRGDFINGIARLPVVVP